MVCPTHLVNHTLSTSTLNKLKLKHRTTAKLSSNTNRCCGCESNCEQTCRPNLDVWEMLMAHGMLRISAWSGYK